MLISTVLPLGAELVSSEGDARHWVVGAKLETVRTPAQVAAMFREGAAAGPGWSEIATARTATAACFGFRDYDGSPWRTATTSPPRRTAESRSRCAEADAPAIARQ